MSTTPDDVKAITEDWVDVYLSTGITVGTGLRIQNKSDTVIILKESVGKPTGLGGYEVLPFNDHSSDTYIEAGSTGCWVRAKDTDSYILVQEA